MAKFEKLIAELETTVQALERSDLDLDKAIGIYQKGIKLVAQTKKELTGAEKKVKQLVAEQGQIREEAFE